MPARRMWLLIGIAAALACGCATPPLQETSFHQYRAQPPLHHDATLEAQVEDLLGQLSLEQKIAQMIQADIGSVSAAQMTRYRLGAVLNGGGQTPGKLASTTADDWVGLADALYRAAMVPAPGAVPIPPLWGTDAIHGHGNVTGATLFPHNIALGATRNGPLVRDIAAVTAREVAATGLDWTFAPTVAVARDDRWGRAYESFSEDPRLTAALGAQAVLGYQGNPSGTDFLADDRILATAKHFLGDGGTRLGDDQGNTEGSETELLALHLPPYIAAIEAGVQTVMASYNAWNGVHSHAHARLLTDLLKGQLGFDGVVVSDWQAIAHIPGCSIDRCAEAVNAGVDLFMIPNSPDWQRFHANTLAQVRAGEIALARIDDAVRRILRVKLRAGLLEKPAPAERPLAGRQNLIGAPAHRALARQAVRESLVLLKNTGVLPIAPQRRILLAGNAADAISYQAGGWSVSWSGKGNANELYPGATSVYRAFANGAAEAGGEALLYAGDGEIPAADVAVVVMGEEPYAEMMGDIENLDTLEFERGHKQSLQLIKRLKQAGLPVVAVLFSGRPLWINPELNAADAVVAAWQPGSEGAGVSDVLLARRDGTPRYDFRGKLSFSWPRHPCQTPLNKGDSDYDPLFPFGFGLSYEEPGAPFEPVPEDSGAYTYGCLLGAEAPAAAERPIGRATGYRWQAEGRNLARAAAPTTLGPVLAELEGDTLNATFAAGGAGRVALRNDKARNDFLEQLPAGAALVFEFNQSITPTAQVRAGMFSGPLGGSFVEIADQLMKRPTDTWQTLAIDLRCFTRERLDLSKVDAPFVLESLGPWQVRLRNVRFAPAMATTADIGCGA